jgi:putative redox protein
MPIRAALEKLIRIFEKRPKAAFGTGSTQVQLLSGTRCEITEGEWKMVSDQSKETGGKEEGPGPGFLGRGALGVCIAQGYALIFAQRYLTFRSIDVEVQGDTDMRGFLGMNDSIAPGYQRMRYLVSIESDEDKDTILAAVEHADQHSPWLYNLTAALDVDREFTIKRLSQKD